MAALTRGMIMLQDRFCVYPFPKKKEQNETEMICGECGASYKGFFFSKHDFLEWTFCPDCLETRLSLEEEFEELFDEETYFDFNDETGEVDEFLLSMEKRHSDVEIESLGNTRYFIVDLTRAFFLSIWCFCFLFFLYFLVIS